MHRLCDSGTLIILPKSLWAVTDNQTDDSSPHGGNGDQEPQEIRMIGDFDSGAKAPWIVYRDEAKSYDETHIQTLKDAMDRILIFVRPYSVCI